MEAFRDATWRCHDGGYRTMRMTRQINMRGRGQYFGEASGRVAAGVLAPFLLEPYTGSPVVFFGTLLVVALIGAFVPVLFGKETVGQLETVTEGAPELT